MDQYWHNTIDFQPPSLASISAGIKIIDAAKQRRHGVYVHCKAGKGRSAIVVACYLMKVSQSDLFVGGKGGGGSDVSMDNQLVM